MVSRGKATAVIVSRKDEVLYFPSLHKCARGLGVSMTTVRRAIHSEDGYIYSKKQGKKGYHIDEALPSVVKEMLEEKCLLSSLEELKGIRDI